MKKSLSLLAVGGLTLGLANAASAEDLGGGWSLSSEVALTTNYVYRGFSESDEEFAIQGGFEGGHDSGAYLGVWASSLAIDYGAVLELDYYAGYGFDLTPDVWGDVGLVYYGYPELTDIDTTELYAGAGSAFGALEGDFYLHLSDDYFGSEESSVYLETNWLFPIAADFYAGARFGYLLIDDQEAYDYAVGAGYGYGTLDLNLSFADHEEGDDSQVAFTLTRAF